MTNAMLLEKIREYCESVLENADYNDNYAAGKDRVAAGVLDLMGRDQ